MARVGHKYAALFELAALPGCETDGPPPDEWASRLLRLMASASWSDPSFLEEVSESNLIRVMCRVLPVLKANAANRATSSSIQDLADLEEAMRKLRHELALAEKRLPSHGQLGNGGSAFYTTWACVGHVCTLMLQALTYSAAMWSAPAVASTPRASPPPANAALGSGWSHRLPHRTLTPGEAGEAGTGSQTPGEEAPEGQTRGLPDPAASAAMGSPSGPTTPGGASVAKPVGASPNVAAGGSSGFGNSVPALATEAALLKLLGNKHVAAHVKDVMHVVQEQHRAALTRILLTQINTEMKATHSGLTHILQILKGDPTATSPAPSALPKAWFGTASLLVAFSEPLKASLCIHAAGGPAGAAGSADASTPSPAAVDLPGLKVSLSPTPSAVRAAPRGDHGAPSDSWGANSAAKPADGANPWEATNAAKQGTAEQAPQAATDGKGDVEMADVEAKEHRREPALPTPGQPGTVPGAGEAATASPAGTSTPAATPDPGSPDDGRDAVTDTAAAVGRILAVDPRVALSQLLEDLATALCEAVTGAHGVGRIALLLRGEASAKFSTAASYMPAALSINELMAHLDALASVGTALGAKDRVRPSIASLLASQAMKELLGAGKVYVTTVIAAGALTRDLAIDAVIPQSLRQGYMAAVMTPLETGALLNERRTPQVLAYRNSITESSYYQVMDADTLPYGVNVRFEDEQEAEGMGVVREWLSQIAADIFSTERGLFVRGAADRRVVHPAPHSRMVDDCMGYMRFAGRIMGLALRANVPLGVVLSTGLFSYLTGRRATLQDLQQIDPQVYSTCQNILSDPGAEALGLFHVWHGSGEGSEEQELLPGGASLPVTDANKVSYVELLAHHVVLTVVDAQCAAFLTGVQDTAHHLPDDMRLRRAFLTPLLLEDLNRITAGESSLDPEDWAEHTDVAGFESAEEQESLDLFWQLVSEYTLEDRQRLLQFWTAMTHLPSGGFKALNQRLQVMKLGPSAAGQGVDGGGGEAGRGGAAAAASGHGPSADGAGPHSHRLDGESLEADEQSDGLEDSAANPEAAGAQQQQPAEDAGGAVRVGAAGGAQGARAAPAQTLEGAHAAPAAEPDLAGRGEAAMPATAAGDGAAAVQAPSTAQPSRPVDDGEMPYGDDDEELGAGEDAMDYGEDEEGDDEEFQRQLEMALALSLQDMPSEQAERNGPSGAAGGAGGDGDGSGGAGQLAGGGSGGNGSGEGFPAGSHAAGQPPEPVHAGVPGEQPAQTGPPAAPETAAASELESPTSGAGSSMQTSLEEGAATPRAHPAEGDEGPVAQAPNSTAPAAAAEGGAGMRTAPGGEPTAGRDAAVAGTVAGAEGRSVSSGAVPPATASPEAPSAAGGDVTTIDAMDSQPASATAATTAAGGHSAGAGGGGSVREPMPTAAVVGQAAAAGNQQALDAAGEEDEQPRELQAEAQRTGERLEGGTLREGGQQAADAMEREEAASSLSPDPGAAAAPLEPCRALPLLPQSRTCFLQLNLPVYGNIDEMRRAFAIALDHMSFGMH